jgi:hypothetical protein
MGAVQQRLRTVGALSPLSLVGADAGGKRIRPDSFDPDAYETEAEGPLNREANDADGGAQSGLPVGEEPSGGTRSEAEMGPARTAQGAQSGLPVGQEPSGGTRSEAEMGPDKVDRASEVAPADRLSVLAALRAKVQPLVGAGEAVLPIREDLQALLPWGGLKRGSTLTVDCSSLLLATVGAATAEGSWAAFVGLPDLGFAAAAEHGVVLERTVAVVAPPFDQAAAVVASLVDAVDVVVVGPGVITRSSDARRLSARARERGSVLIAMHSWPEAVDVSLRVTGSSFAGLGDGHGHIQSWSANVEAVGRGAAARRRQARIVLYAKPVRTESWGAESLEAESVGFDSALPTDNQRTDDVLQIDVTDEFRVLSVAKAG